VTANFRTLYVFVIMELGTRRILHHNVTDHPRRSGLCNNSGRRFQTVIPSAS
jgi:hypothetical protein